MHGTTKSDTLPWKQHNCKTKTLNLQHKTHTAPLKVHTLPRKHYNCKTKIMDLLTRGTHLITITAYLTAFCNTLKKATDKIDGMRAP